MVAWRIVFSVNAFSFIDYFEENNLPFVFTLYPGGGFHINDPTSDDRLRRIFGSRMFRHVIVTQEISRDYLLKHEFCAPENIDLIYGIVTPRTNLNIAIRIGERGEHFGFGKGTLDICFTAHKYTDDGNDKGYNIFLEAAKSLSQKYPECHFHVVGGFGPEDLPIDGLEGKPPSMAAGPRTGLRVSIKTKT